MANRVSLGHLLDVKIEARRSAFVWSIVLIAALTTLAYLWLSLPLAVAFAFGLLATAIHWLSEVGHHMGHAYAARRVGYPMARLTLFFLLGASRYPRDEPALPAETHIRRALGGPIFSASTSFVSLFLVWLLSPAGGLLSYLAIFALVDNFGVMTLGAFLPLGFTDGSTLLYWWPRRGQPAADH